MWPHMEESKGLDEGVPGLSHLGQSLPDFGGGWLPID